mmetsp:Transcript_13522/g.33148  ORF Transcript_13522/g.33148 Transcript_13522/m.33148 type:complete len:337 (+) Transcript_13522:367-1377(+)
MAPSPAPHCLTLHHPAATQPAGAPHHPNCTARSSLYCLLEYCLMLYRILVCCTAPSGAHGLVVQLDVVERGAEPRPVHAHCATNQLAPPPAVAVPHVERAVERVVHARRVSRLKHKPVGLHAGCCRAVLVVVHVKHGVRQPARLAHNGDGAVLHRDHLRQPARLKHGGHHDDVGGRVDEVRQRLVVLEAERGVGAAHALRKLVELGLHLGVGRGAQQHVLPAALQRLPGRVLNEVDALLRYQPRHARYDGHVRARQPQPLPQRALGRPLALARVVGAVRHGQVRVVGRVPHVGVDAIADAVQLAQVRRDGAAAADLGGVGGRHGGGHVARRHRAPH